MPDVLTHAEKLSLEQARYLAVVRHQAVGWTVVADLVNTIDTLAWALENTPKPRRRRPATPPTIKTPR